MAAAVYDLESLLIDIKALMTANLNTRISAIDAEKTAAGQTLTPVLATIGSGDYYLQTFINKILNSPQFVYYGIEESKSTPGGGVTAQLVKVWVTIGILDSGNTNDAYQRSFRYIRALKEVFEDAHAKLNGGGGVSKIKIETLTPVSLKLDENSSEEYKLGGVSLLIGLA